MPTTSRLTYVTRVRDLVHGYVHLTQLEVDVISHPLFQRLRHIRQNDVAFFVYPSLNTSRFEHSLGCAHVAGEMAINFFQSDDWEKYKEALELNLGLNPKEFLQVCRLYGLLHDVGHLPLSHLFETAFKDYILTINNEKPPMSKKLPMSHYCNKWFKVKGFDKPHEACGAALTQEILSRIKIDDSVKKAIITLMTKKSIPPADPLHPIKELIDSEVDADRIDSTARDGLTAGREYGNYDIQRLCSSVFVQQRGGSWRIAYSHKAIGSIEGLLLDRCRTHEWIHFHHRVVSMKVAMSILIVKLLKTKKIKKASFPITKHHTMALRDDPWLWSKVRNYASSPEKKRAKSQEKEVKDDDGSLTACINSLLYRDNSCVTPLWKNRGEFEKVLKPLHEKITELALPQLNPNCFGQEYEDWLTDELGIKTVAFWVKFKPLSPNKLIPLTDECGKGNHGSVQKHSSLESSLKSIWSGELWFYIVFLGNIEKFSRTQSTQKDLIKKSALKNLKKKWTDLSLKWVHKMAAESA